MFNSKMGITLLFITGLAGCTQESEQAGVQADIQAQAVTQQTTDEAFTHGKKTHNSHCYKCHTDEVYKRDDRFVKTLDALSKQVVRCRDNTEAAWFDEDTEAVVHFLNTKYYKF